MADSAVGFLLQTLGSLIDQEASLLQGLHSSIREIQLELERMRSFLKDADRRQSSEDGVRTWVKEVRDATYDVEDIIDKYTYRMTKKNRDGGLLRGALNNTILLPEHCWYKHQIATELQSIKSEIKRISEGRKTYEFREEGSSSTSKAKDGDEDKWGRSGDYAGSIPDDDIVGIERSKNFLITRLLDERPERVVVAVVGMGGLGKTTLVTKAYNSPEIKEYFNCQAWITVSESYKVDELLRSMIKELFKSNKEAIPESLDKLSIDDLLHQVKEYLQEKRYVIVLDDVWKDVWKDIQFAFPNDKLGGRIVLTTRNQDVALFFGCDEDHDFLYLRALGEEDAWDLFCKRAFRNKTCPPELKLSAESLVRKCEGLPLAIVTIGRLMSTKEKSRLEWKKVEDGLNWQLSNNENLGSMKNILLLSFNDLPYNLKYCFLHCSLFPEDFLIPQKRLIRLWVAEGFVEERKGLTLEDVAADYIKELIYRSMLQVVKDDDRVRKLVRMHDVLRALALSIGNDEKFCNVFYGIEEIQKNTARRLSMYNTTVNIQSSTCNLRSLMLFTVETPAHSLHTIATSIKLLRVLDLQNSSIKSVPDELVELLNLRYLSLRNTGVEELPESIGRCRDLQTLDIRNSNVKTLPRGVEKLKKLRHLYTYSFTSKFSRQFSYCDFPDASDGICNLKCLQTLHSFGAKDETVTEVGNLTQLRRLTIEKVRRHHGQKLSSSIEKMESLLHLIIKAATEEEILDLDALTLPPNNLENLLLSGRLERLPRWICSLRHSLTKLYLHWSQLIEDPLLSLQELHGLVRLTLQKAYVGKELCIRRGCFLNLKSLTFWDLPELNQIKIEEESMSSIETLQLISCPELKSIPEGIRYLSSLKNLFLTDIS